MPTGLPDAGGVGKAYIGGCTRCFTAESPLICSWTGCGTGSWIISTRDCGEFGTDFPPVRVTADRGGGVTGKMVVGRNGQGLVEEGYRCPGRVGIEGMVSGCSGGLRAVIPPIGYGFPLSGGSVVHVPAVTSRIHAPWIDGARGVDPLTPWDPRSAVSGRDGWSSPYIPRGRIIPLRSVGRSTRNQAVRGKPAERSSLPPSSAGGPSRLLSLRGTEEFKRCLIGFPRQWFGADSGWISGGSAYQSDRHLSSLPASGHTQLPLRHSLCFASRFRYPLATLYPEPTSNVSL